MARKSVAALRVVPLVRSERPGPPATLTVEQAQTWRSVVDTKPADWFQPDSFPLLEAYCKAIDAHRVISAQLDAFDPEWLKEEDGLKRFEMLTRIQARHSGVLAALATKMRLTQHSRYNAQRANTENNAARGVRPWQRNPVELEHEATGT